MKRVALLVTGKTEEALHHALKRVFPAVEFVMRPRRDGFTSPPLPSPPMLHALGTAPRPTDVERLAAALVAEISPGRRDEKPPDAVVLVDDLELANQGWPERTVEHVRAAVRAHLDVHPWPSATAQEKARDRVRERCSFHVLAPMVEAYFFAEADALVRAGAQRLSTVDAAASDLERFLVSDADFLGPPDRLPGVALPPWATPDRARHPKRYLQFLCDPTGTTPRAYVETDGGRAALRQLDWRAVLVPPPHVQFLRSLIHDLADVLDEQDVVASFAGETHPLTWPPRRDNLLRNI
jgi:hypothetical protein